MRITGERIVTPTGGFNASWQRHAACYQLCAPFLGEGSVLDLGCGSGHAHEFLNPRPSIGLDLDHDCLVGQQRSTVTSDIRKLPFADGSFDSVVCIHAIEHVPDPDPVIAESRRVLKASGVAVFITPNRLTFGRPNEIIDPYHFIEYDSGQLGQLCTKSFEHVSSFGLFGSERYMQFFAGERRKLDMLLRLDPLQLRRLVPRGARQVLYDWMLTQARTDGSSPASEFTTADFELGPEDLEQALDVVAVCKGPE